MSTTAPTQPTNRYPGACLRCGSKIPAGAGILLRQGDPFPGDPRCVLGSAAPVHPTEDDCKKTTKTWQKFESGRRHAAWLVALDEVWAGSGFTRPMMTHVDAPYTGYGNGYTISITGAPGMPRRAGIQPHDWIVVTNSRGQAGDCALPTSPVTGDYYADQVAHQVAIRDAVQAIIERQA